MKKALFLSVTLILTLALLSSCKKSEDTQLVSSFTWNYNGTNYTTNLKAAYLHSMAVGPTIIGGTGTSVTSPGIGPCFTVSSFNAGTYSFGSGSGNALLYVEANGNTLSGGTVILNITINSNDRLSGNFSGNLSNGNPLTGSFSDLLIEH